MKPQFDRIPSSPRHRGRRRRATSTGGNTTVYHSKKRSSPNGKANLGELSFAQPPLVNTPVRRDHEKRRSSGGSGVSPGSCSGSTSPQSRDNHEAPHGRLRSALVSGDLDRDAPSRVAGLFADIIGPNRVAALAAVVDVPDSSEESHHPLVLVPDTPVCLQDKTVKQRKMIAYRSKLRNRKNPRPHQISTIR